MTAAARNFLLLFNCDAVAFADLHTGLTAEAFFGIHGIGFAVFHFIDFNRANVHTFTTANALVDIHSYIVAHNFLLDGFQ